MQFRTIISTPNCLPSIDHKSKILMLGSCFAIAMYERLQVLEFNVFANPQGILFNPISLAHSIERLLGNKQMMIEDLQQDEKLWFSWDHHGSFSGYDQDEVLLNMNKSIAKGADYIRSADWIILTFGTAYVYEHMDRGRVVGNCHKQANNVFERKLLKSQVIHLRYQEIIDQIIAINPKVNILMSVSPVRYLRDGIIDNGRSKAVLNNAVHQLVDDIDQVHYFPAYEILMDDLRDYRFYKRDKIHPTDEAVDYIWNMFQSSIMKGTTIELCKKINRINQSLNHQSIHQSSEKHSDFLQKLIDKMKLMQKNESIDFTEQIKEVESSLSAF